MSYRAIGLPYSENQKKDLSKVPVPLLLYNRFNKKLSTTLPF